jgi:hypothetical protein
VLEGISSLRKLGAPGESHSGVGLKPDLQRAKYVGSWAVGRALARQSVRSRNPLAEIAEPAEKSQRFNVQSFFQECSKESLPSASLALLARVIPESG